MQLEEQKDPTAQKRVEIAQFFAFLLLSPPLLKQQRSQHEKSLFGKIDTYALYFSGFRYAHHALFLGEDLCLLIRFIYGKYTKR